MYGIACYNARGSTPQGCFEVIRSIEEPDHEYRQGLIKQYVDETINGSVLYCKSKEIASNTEMSKHMVAEELTRMQSGSEEYDVSIWSYQSSTWRFEKNE